MAERLWKVLGAKRQSLVSGTKYRYPARAWTRHLDPSKMVLCERGYHYCEGPQVLEWLREGLLCEVERCAEHKPLRGDTKAVSCRLRIVRTFVLDARVLRLFACDCAERALRRERKAGREPDAASWECVRIARLYAVGKATKEELDAAYYAAYDAYAAHATYATAAAVSAAYATAADAAVSAAYAAGANAKERRWQYGRLLELVGADTKGDNDA